MFTNRLFSLLVVVALAVVGILTVQDALATSTVTSDILDIQRLQRSRAADTARWTAMGEYYLNRAEAEQLARSWTADTVRWEAMGNYYQQVAGEPSLDLLRSRAADAARWTAMAEYYQKLSEFEAQKLERARAADAARWNAMAQYYAHFGYAIP